MWEQNVCIELSTGVRDETRIVILGNASCRSCSCSKLIESLSCLLGRVTPLPEFMCESMGWDEAAEVLSAVQVMRPLADAAVLELAAMLRSKSGSEHVGRVFDDP